MSCTTEAAILIFGVVIFRDSKSALGLTEGLHIGGLVRDVDVCAVLHPAVLLSKRRCGLFTLLDVVNVVERHFEISGHRLTLVIAVIGDSPNKLSGRVVLLLLLGDDEFRYEFF